MIGIGVYFAVLTAIVVLSNINMYLDGALTARIGSVLSIAVYAMLPLSFFIFGWKFGLVSLLSWYVLAKLTCRIGNRIAGRILGYRVGIADTEAHRDTLPMGRMHLLNMQAMENKSWRKLHESKQQKILKEEGISADQLMSEMCNLQLNGLHYSLAYEIVVSRKKLAKYLVWRKRYLVDESRITNYGALVHQLRCDMLHW